LETKGRDADAVDFGEGNEAQEKLAKVEKEANSSGELKDEEVVKE
jgi:hypothetical protein